MKYSCPFKWSLSVSQMSSVLRLPQCRLDQGKTEDFQVLCQSSSRSSTYHDWQFPNFSRSLERRLVGFSKDHWPLAYVTAHTPPLTLDVKWLTTNLMWPNYIHCSESMGRINWARKTKRESEWMTCCRDKFTTRTHCVPASKLLLRRPLVLMARSVTIRVH